MILQRFCFFVMLLSFLFLPTLATAEYANEVKITAYDAAAGDQFGISVSSSGDTVIVGAPTVETGSTSDIGSAYVYVRDPGTGNWALQTPLYKPPTERASGDRFGTAVAVSGDTAIIGIPGDDDNGSQAGSAYVFVRDPSTGIWSTQQKLLASDGASGDGLGNDVSISNNTALVASSRNTNGYIGAVYIYERNPSTGLWTEGQKLLPTNLSNSTYFGSSVFLDGDMAIVGATGDDAATTDSGAAYIFVKDSGTGVWSLEQKLLASDGEFADAFGNAVYFNNGSAIVGSFQDDDNGTQSGSAYIFVRDSSTGVWTEQQKLLASDGAGFNDFGRAVGLVGDTVIVGANTAGVDNAGAAYVYLRDPGTGIWTEDQIIFASDGTRLDEFGDSLSISADRVIIGADGDNSNQGSVYIYTQTTVVTAPDITVTDSIAPNDDLSIAFGGVTELTSIDQIVSVTNDGTADLTLGTIAAVDPLVAPFSIPIDNCSNQILTPAANCTLTVRFTPGSVASFIDSFDIPSDDADENPVTISVSGTGTSTTAPEITVTDSVAPNTDLSIAFGDITELTSSDQTVTVTNAGTADLTLGSLAIVDDLVAPFTLLNDLCSGQTLTPAANCTLTVRFTPGSAADFTDSFDIPSDDADENPVTISVSGTGTSTTAPDITVTDSAAPVDDLLVAFGSITKGTATDETITITNDGNADLTIDDIEGANTLFAYFSILNNFCSLQTLAPASTCTLDIRFAPASFGVFSDIINIPSNDSDENPVAVTVSGNGTPIPVPEIHVTDLVGSTTDLQIPFGNLTEGLTSDQTVTITNNGTADLVLGTIASADTLALPYSLQNDLCSGQTLSPATNCTFGVSFAPNTVGVFNESFDIPSNDPDEDAVTVNVSGTGLSTASNNPPSKPRLKAPANGAYVNIDTTNPYPLRWKPSIDPDGDAVRYEVYLCTDSNPLNNCSAESVVNLNSQGEGKALYASALPVDVSNQSNSLAIALLVVLISIVLMGFILKINNQAFMWLLLILSGALIVSCSGGPEEDVEYLATDLSGGTTYHWVVVAKDDQGGETESDTWSFTVSSWR